MTRRAFNWPGDLGDQSVSISPKRQCDSDEVPSAITCLTSGLVRLLKSKLLKKKKIVIKSLSQLEIFRVFFLCIGNQVIGTAQM